MRRVFLLPLALLLLPAVFACVVPSDNMIVTKSVSFCGNVFYLNHGIRIGASNVVVSCETTIFKTWRGGTGITVEGVSNVTIEDCRIVGYDVGFLVKNSARVRLLDNHLVNTKVGARFFNTTQSSTMNEDVSLQSALDVRDSKDNSFAMRNKRINGQFCKDNLCNAKEGATETFLTPKLEAPAMTSWLKGTITGKSVKKLQAFIISGI